MQPTNTPRDDAQPGTGDYNALEHFRRRGVEPPGNLYITLDDVFIFEAWASVTAASYNVSLRVMNPDGEIIPWQYTFPAAVNGVTPTTRTITGVEGFLMSLTINQTTGARGNLFTRVMLQRGTGSGDVTRGAMLLSGYPSFCDAFGYPLSEPDQALDGRGLVQVLTVNNPAAGSDYLITVPTGVNWILRGLSCVLTTSAGVANRQPILRIADAAAHIFAQITAPAVIPASQAVNLTWATGLNANSVGNIQVQGLPAECRLGGGFLIATSTVAIQAGDQYSAMVLELETFVAQ